jgi:hypothetical protein
VPLAAGGTLGARAGLVVPGRTGLGAARSPDGDDPAAAAAEGAPRVNDLLAAGVSMFELARYMGTSVEQIEKTYGHLLPDSLDRTRAALDTFVANAERTCGGGAVVSVTARRAAGSSAGCLPVT